MASAQGIPLPPRTPTPPLDEYGLNGYSNSPTHSVVFDPNSLSPNDENYPANKYGSLGPIPTFTKTTMDLGESDNMSVYSPMSTQSNGSGGGKGGSLMAEDSNGVFNFQPATMPKGPIIKSVRANYLQARTCTKLTFFIEYRTAKGPQVQA